MIGCLRTRVRNQPIIALYFESENVLKLYNLEAWKTNYMRAKQPALFPIKMIAKLQWTQSNEQNIEQLQNPTIGVTINNESTTTEPPP